MTTSNHAIRSLANPTVNGHPDHSSIRFRGSTDNGGVHINSGIANHAFHLAVEGGTHRLSGIAVEGVGGANRKQIEKVFYRAFTQFNVDGNHRVSTDAGGMQACAGIRIVF